MPPSLISALSRRSSKNSGSDHPKHLSNLSTTGSSQTCVSSSTSSPAGQEKKLALTTTDFPCGVERKPSQSSNASISASSSPLSARPGCGPGSERPADRLSVVLADDLRVRRSRCGADFLEELVQGGPGTVDALCREIGKRFRVVSGMEAIKIYKTFVDNETQIDEEKEKAEVQHLVFAVSVRDAGRKLMDYYLTWKGKTKANTVKERRHDFLDSEFRKVARSIDKEFRRASIYGSSVASSVGNPDSKTSLKEAESEAPSPTSEEVKPASRPASVSVAVATTSVELPNESPLSATDSVLSLPYLNMIRNVPVGNRLPLRITNPDRLSMLSNSTASNKDLELKIPQKPVTTLSTVKENEDENQSTHMAENTSISLMDAVPSVSPDNDAVSTASPRSARTKDSNRLPTLSSPSENKNKGRNSNRDSVGSEFVIVLLDEKLMDEKTEKSPRTWHGLERQFSRKSSISTPRRVSPWDGPLARDNGITYRTRPVIPSPENGDSSSSEEEWENAPVIPLQALVMTSLAPSSISTPKAPFSEPSSPVHVRYKATYPTPMLPTSPPYALGVASPSISLAGSAVLPYTHAAYPRIAPRPPTYLGTPYNTAYAASVASVASYHSPVPVMKPLQRSYVGYPGGYLP